MNPALFDQWLLGVVVKTGRGCGRGCPKSLGWNINDVFLISFSRVELVLDSYFPFIHDVFDAGLAEKVPLSPKPICASFLESFVDEDTPAQVAYKKT